MLRWLGSTLFLTSRLSGSGLHPIYRSEGRLCPVLIRLITGNAGAAGYVARTCEMAQGRGVFRELLALFITHFTQAVIVTMPFTLSVYMASALRVGGAEQQRCRCF